MNWPMSGGCDADETAVKIMRKWGYNVKKVEENKGTILFPKGVFWGRSLTACGGSDDLPRKEGFEPYAEEGFDFVDFNDAVALEAKLKSNKNIVGFICEPIQGENGIILPKNNYLKEVRRLTKKYNVLLAFDEIQSGLGRAGYMLGYHYESKDIRPDMVVLAKSLSGGMFPVSTVLADKEIFEPMRGSFHGTTYSGHALSLAVAEASLKVIVEEGLCENSLKMGEIFRGELEELKKYSFIKDIRGSGLFNAIEFQKDIKFTNQEYVLETLKRGLLMRHTKTHIIRALPPLIIDQDTLLKGIKVIKEVAAEMAKR